MLLLTLLRLLTSAGHLLHLDTGTETRLFYQMTYVGLIQSLDTSPRGGEGKAAP